MTNLWDANTQVIIATALVLIVLLLMYVAFWKDDIEKQIRQKNRK